MESYPTSLSSSSENQTRRAFLEKGAQNAFETSFFKNRGLTEETVKRFGLGYNPQTNCALFPTADGSYEVRSVQTSPNEPLAFRYQKTGKVHLFHAEALHQATQKPTPVWITEGILDALSILQCGGQAVALCGVNNTKLLLEALDALPSLQAPLILALDTDEAGQNCATQLQQQLTLRKIAWRDPPAFLNAFHDPNDALMANAEGLQKAIQETQRTPGTLLSTAYPEYAQTNAACLLPAFEAWVDNNRQRSLVATGFPKIDEGLGGGLPYGLTLLGAVSSLGKTTFLLQIADFQAAHGTDVLFFTLEQGPFELLSKSLSRETYALCRAEGMSDLRLRSLAFTAQEIARPSPESEQTEERVALFQKARTAFLQRAQHLFLVAGSARPTVDQIRAHVQKHIEHTGRTPLVFVDYLQILAASTPHLTDKQAVDGNVTALKQLSRDFDTAVVVISSLNRQSYDERIDMAAFKESGGIEYSADLLVGLQFQGAGTGAFKPHQARSQPLREIEFHILKNRNGSVCSKGLLLGYRPAYNVFIEKKEKNDL